MISTALGYLSVGLTLPPLLVIIGIRGILNNRRVLDAPFRFFCRMIPLTFGIRIRVKGIQNIPPGRTYVIAGNHVNIFDGFIYYGYLPLDFRAIELDSHFSWPVYGVATRLFGNIPISHTRPRSAVRGLSEAAAALTRGISLLILPEGHRTRTGGIGPFMRGPFKLALETVTDILPVALNGAFERKSADSPMVRPGRVEVIIGRPISVEAHRNVTDGELRDHVREVIVNWVR